MLAPEITIERVPARQKNSVDSATSQSSEDGIAREIVGDLFSPKRRTYWFDFLASNAIGWGCFLVCTLYAGITWIYGVACVVCILALYRAVCFTHELVHQRKEALPGFRVAWRIGCGIPLLVPHFLYRGVHIAHHARRDYGTSRDGEYFPFASRPVTAIVVHIVWNLFVPLTAILRFTVLAWVSLLSHGLRETIMRKASSMTLRMTFTRELPVRQDDLKEWRLEERICTLFATSTIIAVALGIVPVMFLVQWYIVLAGIAVLNGIRAIGATHRYHSNEVESDAAGQLTDSVNVERDSILTLAMCPVGLRFHALHHMFPTMPYHQLGEAHRRLRKQLPKDSPYHQCSINGVSHGLRMLWRQAKGR